MANFNRVSPMVNQRVCNVMNMTGCVPSQKKDISVGFNLCNDQWILGWGYSSFYNCKKRIVVYGTGESMQPNKLLLNDIPIGSRIVLMLVTIKRKCNANQNEPFVINGSSDCANQSETEECNSVRKEKYRIWKAILNPPIQCSQCVEFIEMDQVIIDSMIEGETASGHPIAIYDGVKNILYPQLVYI